MIIEDYYSCIVRCGKRFCSCDVMYKYIDDLYRFMFHDRVSSMLFVIHLLNRIETK